jgi:uncharacterized membrane protein YhaH (DUF805 family)
MTFMESVKTCFSKYAVFEGRAGRPEFWWFMLFLLLVNILLSWISPLVGAIFTLATLVPSLAVGARRLHDTDRSGWWQLLCLTVIGTVVLIVFFALPAKDGAPASRPFAA